MQVVLSRDAAKQFNHLPKTEQRKIKRKLILLESDPLVGKRLSGDLNGRCALRAWPYRIIYKINKEQRVEVSAILHRQGVYK